MRINDTLNDTHELRNKILNALGDFEMRALKEVTEASNAYFATRPVLNNDASVDLSRVAWLEARAKTETCREIRHLIFALCYPKIEERRMRSNEVAHA